MTTLRLTGTPVALAAARPAARRASSVSAKRMPTTTTTKARSAAATAERVATTTTTMTADDPQPPSSAAAAVVASETATETNLDDASDDASAIAKIVELVTSAAAGTRGAGGLSARDALDFDAAVAALESSPRRVRDPAFSPLLAGRWKLLFTSKPGTNSPIQQFFTGNGAFEVHQEVTSPVINRESKKVSVPGSVTNVVTLLDRKSKSTVGTLRVLAATSTAAAPLPGFTPRKGAGLPLLRFLGTSAIVPPRTPGERLDFAFKRAAFYFSGESSGFLKGLSVPYPVPFETLSKLPGELGDEVKGFLDTTYLSPDGTFRLSRGNKGTLFVLERDEGLKRDLMNASELGWSASQVEEAATRLASTGAGERAPAKSPLAAGRWRLVWSEQAPGAAPLQRALAGRVANWQVIGRENEEGDAPSSSSSSSTTTVPLKNVVGLLPGVVELWATAECSPASETRTRVDINGLELRAGPGGKFRLLRVDRTSRTESDTGPALFPKSRRSKAPPATTTTKKNKKSAAVAGTKSTAAAQKQQQQQPKKDNNNNKKAGEEENVGFVDWLYLDEDMRVTRGSKGSLFLHVREREV